MLYLYKISQVVNNDWDTFDSAVVVASDIEAARCMTPDDCGGSCSVWCEPEDVQVEYIGIASNKYTEQCLIISSFNAG